MATEYIGSRYVPKFTDNPESQWTNTVTYEPLTIVLYQGNSYTSRQFVPIGIDISNTDYWAETGNYNAQVEAYRQEVATFDSRITANANGMSTNAQAITNEATARQNVDAAINNTLGAITPFDTTPTSGSTKGVTSGGVYIANANQNAFITNLRELTYVDTSKVALIFGDSIARGYGTTTPGSTSWGNKLANRLGITAYNFAVDGASFQYNIKDQVVTAHNSTTFDDSDVAYIFVSGGINDHGHTYNNIANGLASFFTNIQTYYPNAQVIFLPLLCAAKPLDSIDQGDQQYIHSQAGMFLLNICHTAQWPNTMVISDGYTWLQGYPTAAADQVHPNDTGAQIIANNVYSFLRFGYLPPKLIVGSISWDSGISDYITSGAYNFYGMNDRMYYLTGKLNFSDVSNISVSDTLITLPDFMWGRQNQTEIIECVSNYSGTTGTVYRFELYKTNNALKFWTIPPSANMDFYIHYVGMVGL